MLGKLVASFLAMAAVPVSLFGHRDSAARGFFTSALALCILATGCQPRTTPVGVDVRGMTLVDIQQAMQNGRLSAANLVAYYLARIDALDSGGPALRSVIRVNPHAMQRARELDAERLKQGMRGPLHGIPVLLKDNIDTAKHMPTTGGSLALARSLPPRDATVTQRLRHAGAIILGKANLSEWANFRSLHSSSGWSGVGGQTKNPYVLDRNPCGSSSGSAVAVAADLATLAVGTETDGSIVCPSSANGIVGIKPTVGLVSRAGIIPISHTQDTAGPMARTVADAAAMLGVLAGSDPRDAATIDADARRTSDYTESLDANALRGARLGIARNLMGFHPRVDELMEEAFTVLRAQGATLVDVDLGLPDRDAEMEVLLYEFKADLNDYLATLDASVPVHNLEELIAFNETHREKEMPYFEQEIFAMAQAKGDLESPAYRAALAKNLRLARAEGIDKALRDYDNAQEGEPPLDALLAPTMSPAWTTDVVNGDHFIGSSSAPAAVAGYPNITVPAGYIYKLPIGISFFGTAYSEPRLIALAYAYEEATRHRQPPQFLPSLGTAPVVDPRRRAAPR